jgi:hypothetical protein
LFRRRRRRRRRDAIAMKSDKVYDRTNNFLNFSEKTTRALAVVAPSSIDEQQLYRNTTYHKSGRSSFLDVFSRLVFRLFDRPRRAFYRSLVSFHIFFFSKKKVTVFLVS